MRMITIHGSRELTGAEGLAVRLAASRAMEARHQRKLEQSTARREALRLVPKESDDTAMRRLVLSVEDRIVEAVWTERCLPGGGSGGRCGISYLHERSEIFANAVAAGDWQRPHPGRPAPKAIDRMHEPLSWLAWLSRETAAIVRAAALSKEGDPDANVGWGFVRRQVVAAEDISVRTLQRRYDAGLNAIAARLALA